MEDRWTWMSGSLAQAMTVSLHITFTALPNPGTYLLLDSTDSSVGDFAILRSPVLASSKQYGCLSFYYVM